MTTFRQHRKEGLEIQVPPQLASRIRAKAARERRSISEVGTEALARGFGLDPATFGIETTIPSSSTYVT
jgi:hypothetical protein